MHLDAVHGSDEADVWAVGTAGAASAALQYDGKDWVLRRVPEAAGAKLRGVWVGGFADVRVIANDRVYRWDGQAWTSREVSAGLTLTVIGGVASDDLWVAGHSSGAGQKTHAFHWDGSSWTEEILPTLGEALALSATASNDVWLVGGDEYPAQKGRILHWNGSAWSESFNQAPSKIRDVVALSPSRAWACDGSSVLSWNGGAWARLTGPTGWIERLSVVGGGLVAVTDAGKQYALSGTAWSSLGDVGFGPAALWPKVEPKMAVGAEGQVATAQAGAWARQLPTNSVTSLLVNAPWGASGSDLWAFTWGGWPLHWDGTRWAETTAPYPLWNTVSWGTGPHDLWALALGIGTIEALFLHNDGTGWTSAGPPPPIDNPGLWAATPTDLWAVGSNPDGGGEVYRGDGATWSKVLGPEDVPLSSVWGSSGDDVWVPAGTAMLHWNGSSWTRYGLDPAFAEYTHEVIGTGPDDVMVVTATTGANGNSQWRVFRWRGEGWVRETAFDAEVVEGLCTLGKEYWAVTRSNKVFHWDGASWSSLTVDATRLSRCWATPDRVVRVFGDSGAILGRQY
ncbi:MAG TPA: hypothetical protein VGK67_33345 [Myxococcales bacterium]